jgi:hypothetical protein
MTDFRALCAELTDALNNLHALVWGECPSLLNEDQGGSGFLDLEIEETLTTARAALAQPEPVAPPMPVPGDAEGLAEVFWGRYEQPEPQGPSDQELLRLYRVATPCYEVEEYKRELDFARAVLARWGTPANAINQEDYDRD